MESCQFGIFQGGDDFKFTFPTDFDEQDPLFVQSEDNAAFTVADIRERLVPDIRCKDLDNMANKKNCDCKKHFAGSYISILDPLVKNQERIACLETM